MTIARTFRLALFIAVASVTIAAIGAELFYLHWLRSIVASGNRHLLGIDPGALEHDLRADLPPGTSKDAVESALRKRHVEFSDVDVPWELRAVARDLKGSTPLVETNLSLEFHFDNAMALKSIDSRVVYSGL